MTPEQIVRDVCRKHKRLLRRSGTKAGEVVAAMLLQIEAEIVARLQREAKP